MNHASVILGHVTAAAVAIVVAKLFGLAGLIPLVLVLIIIHYRS